LPRLYLLRYAFEYGNGFRHGVLRPYGIWKPDLRLIEDRQAWTYGEATEARDRLNEYHGAGSHWIIRENDE